MVTPPTTVVKIPIQEIIDSFSESLGEEGARTLVKEAVKSCGFLTQADFTKEQTILILNHLQEKEGFVGILAGILIPRIIIRNV